MSDQENSCTLLLPSDLWSGVVYCNINGAISKPSGPPIIISKTFHHVSILNLHRVNYRASLCAHCHNPTSIRASGAPPPEHPPLGIERWASAFYAQKGLDPDKWPEAFRKIVGELPEGIRFL